MIRIFMACNFGCVTTRQVDEEVKSDTRVVRGGFPDLQIVKRTAENLTIQSQLCYSVGAAGSSPYAMYHPSLYHPSLYRLDDQYVPLYPIGQL